MALHSSTLAWKIPWTEEPGRLQSMGSWRVGHDSNFTFTFTYILLYKEALGKKLGKEQKTRRITTVTKGITRNNNRHKARRQSITWVTGSWLNNVTLGEQVTEGNPCMCSIPWPQSWEQLATLLVPVYQERIRKRGFMRNRKQHTEILKLNVPWQISKAQN